MILSVKMGKGLKWQTVSSSCSWPTVAGPAGRRLAASFGVVAGPLVGPFEHLAATNATLSRRFLRKHAHAIVE